MKCIKDFIIESAKFNYWTDVIEFPGHELKCPKKYIKPIKPKYYKEEFLAKYFGWINQWIDKNIKNIIKVVVKDNKDLPEKINIQLPSKLSGKLCFEWDCGWRDGNPIGTLRSVEIEVNNSSPSGMGGEFYDIKKDLEQFKLNEPIKI